MHEGFKVVATQEMARVEKEGDHESYMLKAGMLVARVTMQYIEKCRLAKKVTLLVGKGNNGGDAFTAGIALLAEGYEVSAYLLFDKTSVLNEKFHKIFLGKKGKITEQFEGVIIDGLLGTGFKGELEKRVLDVIEKVNASGLPVIAIDIPSGLNGSTGVVGEKAIFARETVTLGIAKIGLFLEEGWNYVGRLHIGNFGLSNKAIAEAEALCYLPKYLDLPKILRTRHKYSAGFVLGYAGSTMFKGAPKLAGLAALKAGAGIVKVFCPKDLGETPFELISVKWSATLWKEALRKAKAVFIGPGLGKCKKWLKKNLSKIKLPCVIDADALQPNLIYPKGAILTPHRNEALRMLGLKAAREDALFSKVIRFCQSQEIIVILKGAPSFIFSPHHKPLIIPRGDPGMASAGTGDVLTGMIAAILAQGCIPYEAAMIAVTLHAIAGEKAAVEKTSYCLNATDLISYLPEAFKELMKRETIVATL